MRHRRVTLSPRTALLAATCIAIALYAVSRTLVARVEPPARSTQHSGFRDAERTLTPPERSGREIWFNATAGNNRFLTYVFQQRLGVLIDWFGVLGSTGRDTRFTTWGIINDPDCCAPGTP